MEKIEFHQSWFEIVQLYSVRTVTVAEDKGMAIAGVAYFVQQNTGLKYAAGLWADMLPFNLLWFASGNLAGIRPRRSAPTWSWTSIDGKISHNLISTRWSFDEKSRIGTSLQDFRSPWAEVNPLIADTNLIEEDPVDNLVHNATLRLQGYVCKLDISKVEVAFDISDVPPQEELHFLPVLSLKDIHSNAKIKTTQMHGIMLRYAELPNSRVHFRFERVGYFWTVDPAVIGDLRGGKVSYIEIV